MAIARDAFNYLNFTATSGTKSHTVSGANTLLVVFTANSDGADNITGVTYNGVALTQLGTGVAKAGGNVLRTWYLLAPTSGANNVVVSRSTSNDTWCLIISYNGVEQTGFPDTYSQVQDTTSPMSATITTVADNCVAIMVGFSDAGQTASTGSIFVGNNTSGAFQLYESSSFPITPAGSYTMNYTQTDNTVANSIVSFAPVPIVLDLSVFDTLTITENITKTLISDINKSDNLTITENVSLLIPTFFKETFDTLTITEEVAMSSEGLGGINVSQEKWGPVIF